VLIGKVMRYALTCFIFAVSFCFADRATISLLNDSPYFLKAVVETANGVLLGEDNLNPGEFKRWTTEFKPDQLKVPGTPNSSLTPFRVIWECKHGGVYSVCDQASPGALIRASICPGDHYCAPEEEKEECPDCNCICPECPPCLENQKESN